MSDTEKDAPVGVSQEPAGRSDEERELAERLVAEANEKGLGLVGPDGVLTGLTRRVLEAGLEAELTEHLGYDKHAVEGRDGGNSRNGTRPKTVRERGRPGEVGRPAGSGLVVRAAAGQAAPAAAPRRGRDGDLTHRQGADDR
jgi:hypothetical protein